MKAILAIDQGTTSTRAIAFSVQGKKLYSSQLEFKQYFPKNGWVEHDPEEIWKTTIQVVKDVINKCRKKEIVYPRQIIMYLLRDLLTMGYQSIGGLLGGRDHTTIMHGFEKMQKKIVEQDPISTEIQQIKTNIRTASL